MFGRILVAVAADEIAGQVARVATELAEVLEARVLLVHALPPVPEIAAAIPEAILIEREDAGRAFLDIMSTRFPRERLETLMPAGAPDDEIIAAARVWRADLLVVGTHRRGGLARLILGGVAEGVLRQAPCPVLVVPKGAETA
jgi:nucleotide-binding universal stress UspA family protein